MFLIQCVLIFPQNVKVEERMFKRQFTKEMAILVAFGLSTLSGLSLTVYTVQWGKGEIQVIRLRYEAMNEGHQRQGLLCCSNGVGETDLHVVEETEYHPKNHVHNPYHNRHLHFVGVQESQLV